MEEEILSFDEMTEQQKWLAVEHYKHVRLTDDDEEYVKECESYTDEDWYECASDYQYVVQYFDDEDYCVYCLF